MLDDIWMWFWEAALTIIYTTGGILDSNFWYQNKEINYRILIKYARDDIAWKLFRNNVTMKENKIQIFKSLMEPELKITCTCHQAKIERCCQTSMVAPIAQKNCTGRLFNILNPNLPSDLLADHSGNTSCILNIENLLG